MKFNSLKEKCEYYRSMTAKLSYHYYARWALFFKEN